MVACDLYDPNSKSARKYHEGVHDAVALIRIRE